MDSERFERVAEVFAAARVFGSDRDQEREVFLHDRCGDDTQLLREVLSLLEEHERDTTSLGANHRERLARSWAQEGMDSPEALPERIGPYRIESVLGRGGMSVVYLARQEMPERQIALKVLPFAPSDERARARFELEGELLAHLDHPGIAKVYEAGAAETERGPVPYIAMELVRGLDLACHAETHRLDRSERVALIADIAEAVQHAHERGVVHRDLKPANVIVDQDGRPRVLDFGIARATNEDMQRTTLQTLPGQVFGTIRYMSPEQASGLPGEVDTRSDIYSLGVILYELLSGRAPYAMEDSSLPVALRTISEQGPEPLPELAGERDGDLRVIVDTALAKEKSERYASADEFACDLRRYLAHQTIHARPASRLYVFRKLVRRNPGTSAAIGLFSIALIAALIVTSLLFARSEHMRRAESYRHYLVNMAAMSTRLEEGRIRSFEQLVNDAPTEFRGWEWEHHAVHTKLARRTIEAHETTFNATLSADGSTLVTGAGDGEIAVWDALSGELVERYPREMQGRFTRLALNATAGVVIGSGPRGMDRVRLGDDGERIQVDQAQPGGIAISESGERAFSVYGDRQLSTWDVNPWALRSKYPVEFKSIDMRVDRTGRAWFIANEGLFCLQLADGTELWRRSVDSPLRALVLDEEMNRIATGDAAGVLTIREATSGELTHEIRAHEDGISSIAMDDDRLATASWTGHIHIWDLASGLRTNRIAAHDGHVVALAFNNDGLLISAGEDGRLRWWQPDASATHHIPRESSRPQRAFVDASADGRWLVTKESNGVLRVRDARTGELTWSGGSGGHPRILEATAELAIPMQRELVFVELATGAPTRELALDGRFVEFWIALGGERLLVRRSNEQQRDHGRWPTDVELYDARDLRRLGHWPDRASPALSSDRRTLFTVNMFTFELEALDLETGAVSVLTPGEGVYSTTTSPNYLAFALDPGGSIEIRDATGRERIHRLSGHPSRIIKELAFHPDGTRLASIAENDDSLRIWDLLRGEQVHQIRLELDYAEQAGSRFGRGLSSVTFSADGHRLLVGGMDGSVWVLESDLEQCLAFWGERELVR